MAPREAEVPPASSIRSEMDQRTHSVADTGFTLVYEPEDGSPLAVVEYDSPLLWYECYAANTDGFALFSV